MADYSFELLKLLSQEIEIPLKNVSAAVQLLEEGNTVPFIARYRKEATGSLDEVQIRLIQERWTYYKELAERKETILASIDSQGKLTDTLKQQITNCMTKTELEDLYLPYKPKRRTRAMIAREKGLEPLAARIMDQPREGSPREEALLYLSEEKGVAAVEDALAGARDIAAEWISERVDVRAAVRDYFSSEGVVVSKVIEGKNEQPTKYEHYYDFKEKASLIPSHRYLAIRRGEHEGILTYGIYVEPEPIVEQIKKIAGVIPASSFAEQLVEAVQDSYKRLISSSIETELRVQLKIKADAEAISVFAENVRHVLLSSPLGAKSVIGIDPGLRTGCKCAVVDATGKFCESATLFLTQGEHALEKGKKELLRLVRGHVPYAIAIGNGTAGRETEDFVRGLLKEEKLNEILVVSVSEAGASVYSASDCAREEFPDLDLTIRGAISIARRLQDPLSELVKVDPKAIGVGQYQHDVYQPFLQQKLQDVVESCVNQVGVELNTASSSLLSYVAGIGPSLAHRIIKYRESNGPFKGRHELMQVAGMGPKTFEQSAGFLRVWGSSHPLDCSAVHPERYPVVEQMAQDLNVPLNSLVANGSLISQIRVKQYIRGDIGAETLQDILNELKKPGRDPRACFEAPRFQEHVRELKDLKPGMKIEGIVTNVTAFGAFVDIGVHQDGLVHISELSDRYIKDPSEVVRAGDKIQVEVLQVDGERNRISLSAKSRKNRDAGAPVKQDRAAGNPQKSNKTVKFSSNPFSAL